MLLISLVSGFNVIADQGMFRIEFVIFPLGMIGYL